MMESHIRSDKKQVFGTKKITDSYVKHIESLFRDQVKKQNKNDEEKENELKFLKTRVEKIIS